MLGLGWCGLMSGLLVDDLVAIVALINGKGQLGPLDLGLGERG